MKSVRPTIEKYVRARHEAMTEEWVRVAARREKTRAPPPCFLWASHAPGTTLLDTMLMGHPSIEVLEEEPTLEKANEAFFEL